MTQRQSRHDPAPVVARPGLGRGVIHSQSRPDLSRVFQVLHGHRVPTHSRSRDARVRSWPRMPAGGPRGWNGRRSACAGPPSPPIALLSLTRPGRARLRPGRVTPTSSGSPESSPHRRGAGAFLEVRAWSAKFRPSLAMGRTGHRASFAPWASFARVGWIKPHPCQSQSQSSGAGIKGEIQCQRENSQGRNRTLPPDSGAVRPGCRRERRARRSLGRSQAGRLRHCGSSVKLRPFP